MKLRDTIALEALKVTMNHIADTEGMDDIEEGDDEHQLEKEDFYNGLVRGAYMMADDMMRVREE